MNERIVTALNRFAIAAVLVAAGGAGVYFYTAHRTPTETPALRIVTDTRAPVARSVNSYTSVVKRAAPSVVNIYTTQTLRGREAPDLFPFFDDPFLHRFFGENWPTLPRRLPQRQQSLGSGVIVTADGYILTNNHVVEGADEIRVLLAGKKQPLTAKLVGADPHTDIAVIKVSGHDFQPITLFDSDKLEVGDVVLAIGNPFGVGQTVTQGIISALGRGELGITDYEDFIQTDAAINPGNSGGALVDTEGRLIAINTAILSRSGGNQGIGFAVPVNQARMVMERLVKDGHIKRGYLGVAIQPLTEDLAKAFRLDDQSGALVGGVTHGTPAEKSGLKEGDVIVEFQGKAVTDARALRLMVSATAPGTRVTLKILRDGKPREITATLGELPEEVAAREDTGVDADRNVLAGVELADLDELARRRFNLPEKLRGVLIKDVAPTSLAALAGLKPGEVIQEINRRPVDSTRAAHEAVRAAGRGPVLLRVYANGGSRYLVLRVER
ncbi:MAG: DegQ family serine endoprotease [Sulfuricella sp.]